MDTATSQASPPYLSRLPRHVAIIMDGNGRWAAQRGLPRVAGHRAGTENLRRVIESFADHGIKYLTLYAFSTENWLRPKEEVRGLFHLLGQVIKREARTLKEKGVKLQHLGKMEGISLRLQKEIRQAIEMTRDNDLIIVSVALNYGGREEILNAVRRIIVDGVPPETVDGALMERYLYTAGQPDPDLIIRTAGEMRLSNFLIWQSAYSEYYATPTLWPDFGEEEIQNALLAYSQRQRRFGGLPSA
ncbi:MAG: di-trans,poly-cis-decaprenylcistransferase [Chloroflexi bacterium]|nr:di-trans,poly-cis-decaprenylcistransferase [Chloroflexota bacterium]